MSFFDYEILAKLDLVFILLEIKSKPFNNLIFIMLGIALSKNMSGDF